MMRKIFIIGATIGFSEQIASLLQSAMPSAKPSKQVTDFDKIRIDAANRKRAKRIERNRNEAKP